MTSPATQKCHTIGIYWTCMCGYELWSIDSSSLSLQSQKMYLSYDVASGSKITRCNKIGKPLVVYRFTANVMMFMTTLRT